jgi:hypothetical protein
MADGTEQLRNLIPDTIFRSISRHLLLSGHEAEDGFPSGEEEEDSLTGDLMRALRRSRTKPVEVDGSHWSWQLTTRKFRGRGELATESLIGADGIFQIEVFTPDNAVARKGMLFQAKKGWKYRDGTLLEQIRKMETAAPDASAVFDYEPDGYRAASGKIVLTSAGRPRASSTEASWGVSYR